MKWGHSHQVKFMNSPFESIFPARKLVLSRITKLHVNFQKADSQIQVCSCVRSGNYNIKHHIIELRMRARAFPFVFFGYTL